VPCASSCLIIYFGFFGNHCKELSVPSDVEITKCEITVSVCILEGTDSRASGIMGCFPQLLKWQDLWSIKYMLKELYWISEAPLVVLKFELQFVRGDLGPQRVKVLLVLESDAACTSLSGHRQERAQCWF